ncbi:protein trichome birefringence-like 9 [Rhodamnia argentea]|uniref:Protein trichome birefringence-like 9 n=1 Tax=Rhodamnia argentea TaxID=178133 RepID=A0A8B8PAS9_9MYRT|nr:protein trichome birefringence-like 9 [Rhodamnia argentea]
MGIIPFVDHLHLLSFPSKFEREFKSALPFLLLLLISSYVVLNRPSPLGPYQSSLLRLGLFSPGEAGRVAPATAGECDYWRGRWVRDEGNAFGYYNESCPFLDPGFRCRENGRGDDDYLKWRWQPYRCHLPRFDASKLLESSRNGRIVFAGDSLGRNQWESLVCMLSQAVFDPSTIYEANGNPITKHKGYLSIRFRDYNLTVEYYRVPFLVTTARAPRNSLARVRGTIRVDELHWFSRMWVGANVIVFNAGHWWSQDKTSKMGFYFEEKGAVNMTMDSTEAFRRSLQTWKLWAKRNLDLETSHVFFRSYSPAHYSHGSWDKGGQCNISKGPQSDSARPRSEPLYNPLIHEAIKEMGERNGGSNVHFLNITRMTEFRNDGHPSSHREPGTPPTAAQDCSHWCLPGVPDTWNELLYAQLVSRRYMRERT